MGKDAPKRDALDTPSGRSLAITSGKGGVGKTNFSLNVAIGLSEMGKRVLVLDADIGLSNVGLLSGIDPPHTIEDAILGEKTLSEVLVDGPSGVKILSGGSGVPTLSHMDDPTRRQLIREVRALGHRFDFTLIDTGTGLFPQVTDFVLSCREIIMVTTAEPPAITDTYAMIKFILRERPDAEIKLLVNMTRSPRESEEVFDKLNLVVNHFLKREIGYLGFLPADRNIPKAVLSHRPFMLAYPNTKGTKSVRRIAGRLLDRRADPADAERPLRAVPPSYDDHTEAVLR